MGTQETIKTEPYLADFWATQELAINFNKLYMLGSFAASANAHLSSSWSHAAHFENMQRFCCL